MRETEMSHKLICFVPDSESNLQNQMLDLIAHINVTHPDINAEVLDISDSRYSRYIRKPGVYPVFLILKNDTRKTTMYGKISKEDLCSWVIASLG